MSDKTGIEWTDATWNPVTGCTEVSPGCDHCYAKTFAERWRGVPGHHFEQGFDVVLRPERLDQPLRWSRPRRIFVNSMSDLFHDAVPDAFIAHVWAVMAAAEQHTFQVLTKRHGRMRSLLRTVDFWRTVSYRLEDMGLDGVDSIDPPSNVWLGVSVENQQWADIRIPALLDTPAAVRFLSCEPLLGPVDLDTQPWRPIGTCPGSTGSSLVVSLAARRARCTPTGPDRSVTSAPQPASRSTSSSSAIGPCGWTGTATSGSSVPTA
jgi:protein gp37